jgi:hypothetical protein
MIQKLNPERSMPFRALGAIIALLIVTGCQTQLMPTPNLYLQSSATSETFAKVPLEFQRNTVDTYSTHLKVLADDKPITDS